MHKTRCSSQKKTISQLVGKKGAAPTSLAELSHQLSLSLLASAAEVHRHAPALLDLLDFLKSERRVQFRALQLHSEGGDLLRFTEGTRLERFFFLLHMPRNVEGVALAIAEAVDDGAADAALLADCLPQGLCFAPVTFQVLPLGDHKGFLARGQHLLVEMLSPLRIVASAVFVRRGDGSCRAISPGVGHLNQSRHKKQG